MAAPLMEQLEDRQLLSTTVRVPPLAPSGLVAIAQTAKSVAIQYVDNSTTEKSFQLDRSTAGGSFVRIATLRATKGTGLHGFYDKTVHAGTEYAYRLRAVNSYGASAYTDPADTTTPGGVVTPPPSPRNLLFFGNSFTLYNNVPSLVSQIAVADGQVRPNVFSQTTFGWTLTDHLNQITSDGSNNVIDHSLSGGRHWDDVIIQEYSTRATSVSTAPVNGNAAAFRNDAAAIFNHVRQNSPTAHDVLEETWARGALSTIYPTGYSGPVAMQNDLLANYNAAATDANSAHGAGAAEVAKPGEAWRAVGFDRSFYDGDDEYHPSPKGSILAALVLYRTIYHDNTADISSTRAAAIMSIAGLSAVDWQQLTAVADGV